MPHAARRSLVTFLLLGLAAMGVALIDRAPTIATKAPTTTASYVVDIDTWRRTARERTVRSPFGFRLADDLTALPMQIGGWRGEDVPQTNLEALILLEPEQFIQRLYTRADGRQLWLSLIGSRQSKSFHSPQICYDAEGWTTRVSSTAIPLPRGDLYALQMIAARPELGLTQVALYFYIWADARRDPADGLVLFRVTAPLEGSLEETIQIAQSFTALFFTESLP